MSSSTRDGIRLTKHGITLGEAGNEEGEAFGAWMEHAAFAVQAYSGAVAIQGRDYRYSYWYGIAGGDTTTGDPLRADATWRGVMVGTSAAGDTLGNVLQGDASLTYRFTDRKLDAAFTGIKDLDRLAAHSIESVRFDDVPVYGSDFYSGFSGRRIRGNFYGPDHAEAAGVFEQSNIVGAFGAKRER